MQSEDPNPYIFMIVVMFLAGVGLLSVVGVALVQDQKIHTRWMTLCIKEQRADGYPPDRAKTRCTMRSPEGGRRCR